MATFNTIDPLVLPLLLHRQQHGAQWGIFTSPIAESESESHVAQHCASRWRADGGRGTHTPLLDDCGLSKLPSGARCMRHSDAADLRHLTHEIHRFSLLGVPRKALVAYRVIVLAVMEMRSPALRADLTIPKTPPARSHAHPRPLPAIVLDSSGHGDPGASTRAAPVCSATPRAGRSQQQLPCDHPELVGRFILVCICA
jgi:hypothetical protein